MGFRLVVLSLFLPRSKELLMINATAAPAMRRFAQTAPRPSATMPAARSAAAALNTNTILSLVGVIGTGFALKAWMTGNRIPGQFKEAFTKNNAYLTKKFERPLVEK